MIVSLILKNCLTTVFKCIPRIRLNMTCPFSLFAMASKTLGSWFPYLLLSSFIIGWWTLAFRTTPPPTPLAIETSQSLALKTSILLEELSPLQRDTLQRALAGNVPLMLEFIHQWDQDALLLTHQGIEGIQRLSAENLLQAHVLGYFLQHSSEESLHQLNCKMNLEWMTDDLGHQLHIKDHFRAFLPQTYLSASFLLAIAHPREIIALPKGLRQLKQLYSSDVLDQIPLDIDQLHSEALYLKQPDLAFVAPYSHPPALEVLRNQNIQLYSLKHIDTIAEIQEALLKIGHASNHILEAQLLAIFMEACFLSIDNRFLALQAKAPLPPSSQRLLYLSYRQHYALPTTKCLTGQLMARALKHCPHLLGPIPQSQEDWQIPFEQEQILQSAPDVIIVSTPHFHSPSDSFQSALHQTKAFQSQRIFCVDETIQESPTQYTALAYFDLFQALTATYCL